MFRTTRRRAWLATMAVAAASVATLIVPASPAAAAPAGCQAGAVCVYTGLNFTGTRYQFFDTNSSWGPWPGIEDDNKSWFNNGTTGRYARIWTGRSCTGGFTAVARGVGVSGSGWTAYMAGSSNDWPWHPLDAAGC